MAWINTKRAKRQVENRRKHHRMQINAAVDDRQRLWAVCHWLLAEALHAGIVPETTDYLTAYIDRLLEGGTNHDRDYAA